MMKRISVLAACALVAFSLCGCASQADAPKQGASEKQEAPATSPKNSNTDKRDLQSEIDDQGQYEEADYPPATWKRYKEALGNARAVLADDDASQDEVDDAERELNSSEYSIKNATGRDHPQKFDYDRYKAGNYHARDGEWVAAACMVSRTFQSDGERLLVATIANDDATLSDHDVLLQSTEEASFDGIEEGDVLAILGSTEEMKQVTIGKSYQEWLPTINVVQVDVAP
ncbi:FIVAR domain-containing protein [Eggerthella lenta]|nr:FIVAR domain-containing protein [Eggerthella lenta]